MADTTEFHQGEFQGMIATELQALKLGQLKMVEALDSFKERTGERIGKTENCIQRLNGEMEIINMIAKWIFAPIFSVVGLAILAVVVWYFETKGN